MITLDATPPRLSVEETFDRIRERHDAYFSTLLAGPKEKKEKPVRGGWDRCVEKRKRHLAERKRQRQARSKQRRVARR